MGLVLDQEGRLLIAEEGAGWLLRLEPSGVLTVLASEIKHPRWLATADDGTLYLSAKGLHRMQRGHRKDQEDNGTDASEAILAMSPTGGLTLFADGLKDLQGIAIHEESLYAIAKTANGDGEHQRSTLLRFLIQPNGQAGPIEILATSDLRAPIGLAIDRLGVVFFTGEVHGGDGDGGGILKWLSDRHLITFATGLRSPRGAAFEATGHLLVADNEDHVGRLLRFRAPSRAMVTAPAFTNQSPLSVAGQADPGSLAIAYRAEDLIAPLASAPTDETSGSFTLSIPLKSNAENALAILAAGAGGLGLTGPATNVSILHDDRPPSLTLLEPLEGAFVRQTTTLRASTADSGSGVATLAFALDGRLLAAVSSPAPSEPFTSGVTFNSLTVPDGPHTLSVTAADRAGNVASTSQSLIVDNTPPSTQITAGPSGEISDATATFTFFGTDAETPTAGLLFSWRIDGGPFTAFSPATSVTFTGLSEGAHLFEVKARDRAGNEETVLVQRAFTVSLLRVTITSPATGATLLPGVVLVRGTVQASGTEVGVIANDITAAVQGTTFAALVPVVEAKTTLTAVATTASGATAQHIVTITTSGTATQAATLLASPEGGVGPLTVAFALVGAQTPSTIELDLEGDGTIDFTGVSLDGLTFTYAQAGLYTPSVTVTDTQGNRFTGSTIVQVYDLNQLDALLQGKWAALKASLSRGDINQALESLAITEREGYLMLLSALSPQLSSIDTILKDISFVSLDGDRAEYQMIRVDNGVRLSHFVLFVKDADGIWRLKFF